MHGFTGAGIDDLRVIMRWSEQLHMAQRVNSLGLSVGLTWMRHGTRQGTIDQVDGLLRFHAGSEELLQWDEQIRSICGQLNGILDSASAKGLKLVEA